MLSGCRQTEHEGQLYMVQKKRSYLCLASSSWRWDLMRQEQALHECISRPSRITTRETHQARTASIERRISVEEKVALVE